MKNIQPLHLALPHAPLFTPPSSSSTASSRWLLENRPDAFICEIRRGIASIFSVIQAFDWGNADVEPSQVDLSKVTVPHALYLAQVISTCQEMSRCKDTLLLFDMTLIIDICGQTFEMVLGKRLPCATRRLCKACRPTSKCGQGQLYLFAIFTEDSSALHSITSLSSSTASSFPCCHLVNIDRDCFCS